MRLYASASKSPGVGAPEPTGGKRSTRAVGVMASGGGSGNDAGAPDGEEPRNNTGLHP